MACPFCSYGMEKKLIKISGVDSVQIDFKTGLAYFSTPIKQKPTKEELSKIITNAGFTVGEIQFSSEPFKAENEN